MNNNKVLTIFRRLARSESWLAPAPSNQSLDDEYLSYSVMVDGAVSGKASAISQETIRRWLSDDLIEPFEHGFRLSATGRSWLKRQLSATDDFQQQHQNRQMRVIDFEGTKRPALVNDAESPLRWLVPAGKTKKAPRS